MKRNPRFNNRLEKRIRRTLRLEPQPRKRFAPPQNVHRPIPPVTIIIPPKILALREDMNIQPPEPEDPEFHDEQST